MRSSSLLRVPQEAVPDITSYLRVIFAGIFFTFLYNFFAAALRSVGNSFAPLLFLLLSTVVNIALDLLFVLVLQWRRCRRGAGDGNRAGAFRGGHCAVFLLPPPRTPPAPRELSGWIVRCFRRIASVSVLTSVQQSIMNFGILLVQSLVNSFGVATMAAFAAGVKIDSFAYSPAQDFANGFAAFVAQNTRRGQAGAREAGHPRGGAAFALLLRRRFRAGLSSLRGRC